MTDDVKNNILAGTVMLEMMWKTKQQDLLDLISPFIIYAIAQCAQYGKIIDTEKVLEYVRKNFGYDDMPISVVEKVMQRNSDKFRKDRQQYTLISSLDEIVKTMDDRKDKCAEKIRYICEPLEIYLNKNIGGKARTPDNVKKILLNFLSRYGLRISQGDFCAYNIDYNRYRDDYYVAKYILDAKNSNLSEYQHFLELIKGTFLRNAIYLQVENTNLAQSRYKDVTFCYDTAFLLRVLKYDNADRKLACELHDTLRKQHAKMIYFPPTEREIFGVLTAYQLALLNNESTATFSLGLFDECNYSASDVNNIKQNLEKTLKDIEIFKNPLPEYAKDSGGFVDAVSECFDETEARQYILDNTKLYKGGNFGNAEERLNSDISMLSATHRLRQGQLCADIERSKAVFVTTNGILARAINEYYHKIPQCQHNFPLAITDSDLAAITWIKTANGVNFLETCFLENAYMALAPTPELIDKFLSLLNTMRERCEITEAQFDMLRSTYVIQKELMPEIVKNENWTTRNTIENIIKRCTDEVVKDELSKCAIRHNKEIETLNDKNRKDKERPVQNADKQARKKAEKYRKYLQHGVLGFMYICEGLFGVALMCEDLKNWSNIALYSWFIRIGALCSLCFTIISLWCGFKKVHALILGKIHPYINGFEEYIYRKKMREYNDIVNK